MRGLTKQEASNFAWAITEGNLEKIKQYYASIENAVGHDLVLTETFEEGFGKGLSILVMAARSKQDSVKCLLKLNQGKTSPALSSVAGDALLILASSANPDNRIIRDLLKLNPRKTSTCIKFGFGAVHYAVNNGRMELLLLLLDAGFDPLKKNDAGNSAIDLACKNMLRTPLLQIMFFHGFLAAGKKMLQWDKKNMDDFSLNLTKAYVALHSDSQMEQDDLIRELRETGSRATAGSVTRHFARLLTHWLETGFLADLADYFKSVTAQLDTNHPLIFILAALEIHHVLCNDMKNVNDLVKIRDRILATCPEIMKKSLEEEIMMMQRVVRAEQAMLKQRFQQQLSSCAEGRSVAPDLTSFNQQQLIQVMTCQVNLETQAAAALLLCKHYAQNSLWQGYQGRYMLLQAMSSLSAASSPAITRQGIKNVPVKKYFVHRRDTENLGTMQKLLVAIIDNQDYGLNAIRQKYRTDDLLCLILLALRELSEHGDWLHEEGRNEVLVAEKRIIQSFGKLLEEGGFSHEEVMKYVNRARIAVANLICDVQQPPVAEQMIFPKDRAVLFSAHEEKEVSVRQQRSSRNAVATVKQANETGKTGKLPDFPKVPQQAAYRYGESSSELFAAKSKSTGVECQHSEEQEEKPEARKRVVLTG